MVTLTPEVNRKHLKQWDVRRQHAVGNGSGETDDLAGVAGDHDVRRIP